MRFIQPCFIRKNTPELREKLRELGQRHNDLDNNEYEWLAANYGMFISVSEGFERLPTDDIDCGTNEELFLALAALRDDTDKNQWFIYNTMDCTVESFRTIAWLICEEDKIEDMLFYDCMFLNARKATAQEIIEHFKNKEERQ